jgi:hypothetical protein
MIIYLIKLTYQYSIVTGRYFPKKFNDMSEYALAYVDYRCDNGKKSWQVKRRHWCH